MMGHYAWSLSVESPWWTAMTRPSPSPAVPFPSVTANDLRRTFASWLANSGVPILQARDLMGHANLAMLEKVYARLAPQTLHAAVALIASSRTA
jgi:integrase